MLQSSQRVEDDRHLCCALKRFGMNVGVGLRTTTGEHWLQAAAVLRQAWIPAPVFRGNGALVDHSEILDSHVFDGHNPSLRNLRSSASQRSIS